MPSSVKKRSASWGWYLLFYRSNPCVLGDLGDVDDFFLVTYHNWCGEWDIDKPQGVRQGTVQASHQMRGSTLKKWKHRLKRLVGGKDASRTRSLVASYRRPSLTTHLLSFPNAAGECCATNPKGRSLILQLQKCEKQDTQFLTSARGRSPVTQIHGLSLGKAATEAKEETEVVI